MSIGASHDDPGAKRRGSIVADRVRGYVYGTIGVLVALGSLGAESHNLRPPVAALMVFVGAVAVWLGHTFSELVAERARVEHRVGLSGTLDLLRSSWPIVTAALPSVGVICLGWAGEWSVSASLRISTGLAVFALGLSGLMAARLAHQGGAGTALDVSASAALGVVIALLEYAVIHA